MYISSRFDRDLPTENFTLMKVQDSLSRTLSSALGGCSLAAMLHSPVFLPIPRRNMRFWSKSMVI